MRKILWTFFWYSLITLRNKSDNLSDGVFWFFCWINADLTIILLFIGCLKRDKRVFELAIVFAFISKKIDDLALWFVGPDEDNKQDDLKSINLNCISSILSMPYTQRPEDYMTTADMTCLPKL